MKQKYKKRLNNSGFTLIELVVVLAILAMLAALAIPQFQNVLENSQKKTDESNCRLVETAVEVYRADTGALPVVTGTDGKIKFDNLENELIKTGYLKNKKIKVQQTGKNFSYDDSAITVTLIP